MTELLNLFVVTAISAPVPTVTNVLPDPEAVHFAPSLSYAYLQALYSPTAKNKKYK